MKNLTIKTLNLLDGISPSSESRIELFKEITNIVKIDCPGDSRFDSVILKIENKKNPPSLPNSNNKVLILASTYNYCDEILIPGLKRVMDDGFDIWIFPHKIDSKRLEEVSLNLNINNLEYSFYSKIENSKNRIILFDKMGILAFAYEKAYYCYVGGAFHHRVHNVLEPAYFGLPIFTGPKIGHAPEAIELNNNDGINIINSTNDFLEFHEKLKDSKTIKRINSSNKNFVLSGKGYSERFYESFLK